MFNHYSQGARVGYLAALLGEEETRTVYAYPDADNEDWRKGYVYGYTMAKRGQMLPERIRACLPPFEEHIRALGVTKRR